MNLSRQEIEYQINFAVENFERPIDTLSKEIEDFNNLLIKSDSDLLRIEIMQSKLKELKSGS